MALDADEIVQRPPHNEEKRSSLAVFWLILLLAVLILGIYIGTLFFGTNSLEVLLELRKKENELSYRVERLRSDNAQLQKEYFELKGLEP